MADDDGPPPVALQGWIDLCMRGGVQFLVHHGVGCQMAIATSADSYALHFTDSGDALLRRGEEAKWVDSILPKRLFRSKDLPDRLFIADQFGSTTWLEEVQQRFHCRCYHHKASTFKFIAETYHYEVRFRSGYVWWAFPWFRDAVFETTDCKWSVKQMKSFHHWFDILGISHSHIRPSHKSVIACAKMQEAEVTEPGTPQEYSWSTVGMLAILLKWIREETLKKLERGAVAGAIFDNILDKFVGREDVAFEVNLGLEGVVLHMNRGRFACEELRRLGPQFSMLVGRCDVGRSSEVDVQQYLQELVGLMMRPSRVGCYDSHSAQVFLANVLTAVSVQADVSRTESWWGGVQECLALQPAPRKGNRLGRLSEGYKLAVVETARTNPEAGTCQSITSAHVATSAATSSPDTCTGHFRLSKDWKEDTMWSYWLTLTETFRKPRALHFATDGVQAGGEKNQVYIPWEPYKRILGMSAPQVGLFILTGRHRSRLYKS